MVDFRLETIVFSFCRLFANVPVRRASPINDSSQA